MKLTHAGAIGATLRDSRTHVDVRCSYCGWATVIEASNSYTALDIVKQVHPEGF